MTTFRHSWSRRYGYHLLAIDCQRVFSEATVMVAIFQYFKYYQIVYRDVKRAKSAWAY